MHKYNLKKLIDVRITAPIAKSNNNIIEIFKVKISPTSKLLEESRIDMILSHIILNFPSIEDKINIKVMLDDHSLAMFTKKEIKVDAIQNKDQFLLNFSHEIDGLRMPVYIPSNGMQFGVNLFLDNANKIQIRGSSLRKMLNTCRLSVRLVMLENKFFKNIIEISTKIPARTSIQESSEITEINEELNLSWQDVLEFEELPKEFLVKFKNQAMFHVAKNLVLVGKKTKENDDIKDFKSIDEIRSIRMRELQEDLSNTRARVYDLLGDKSQMRVINLINSISSFLQLNDATWNIFQKENTLGFNFLMAINEEKFQELFENEEDVSQITAFFEVLERVSPSIIDKMIDKTSPKLIAEKISLPKRLDSYSLARGAKLIFLISRLYPEKGVEILKHLDLFMIYHQIIQMDLDDETVIRDLRDFGYVLLITEPLYFRNLRKLLGNELMNKIFFDVPNKKS